MGLLCVLTNTGDGELDRYVLTNTGCGKLDRYVC